MDEAKRDEILTKISSAISTGNTPGGNTVNVGIWNESALKKLSEAIKNGIYRSNQQQTQKDSTNALSRILNRNSENLSSFLEKGFKSLEKTFIGSLKGIERTLLFGWTRAFPLIGAISVNVLKGVIGLNEFYKSSYADIYSLHESGLNLNAGIDKLYATAGYIGIKSEELVSGLTRNSENVAKLSGLLNANSGHGPFYEIMKTSKEVSKELGLSFGTTLEIAKDASLDFAQNLSLANQGMDALASHTVTYIKFLDKLSKMTGKSAESIAKEVEARDKEIAWKVLSQDPRNKTKIAAMTSLGMSTEVQKAILTGLPNEEFAKWSMTAGNPQIANLIKNFNGENVVELFTALKESAELNRENTERQQNFFRNNSAVAFHMQDTAMAGLSTQEALLGLDLKDVEENERTKSMMQKYADIDENINRIKNKWLEFLSYFTPFYEVFFDFLNKTTREIMKIIGFDFNDKGYLEKNDEKIKEFKNKIKMWAKSFEETINDTIKPVLIFIKSFVTELKEVLSPKSEEEIKDGYLGRFKHHILGMEKNENGEYDDLSEWVSTTLVEIIGKTLKKGFKMLWKKIKEHPVITALSTPLFIPIIKTLKLSFSGINFVFKIIGNGLRMVTSGLSNLSQLIVANKKILGKTAAAFYLGEEAVRMGKDVWDNGIIGAGEKYTKEAAEASVGENVKGLFSAQMGFHLEALMDKGLRKWDPSNKYKNNKEISNQSQKMESLPSLEQQKQQLEEQRKRDEEQRKRDEEQRREQKQYSNDTNGRLDRIIDYLEKWTGSYDLSQINIGY